LPGLAHRLQCMDHLHLVSNSHISILHFDNIVKSIFYFIFWICIINISNVLGFKLLSHLQ
jgi:hypothetical protein